jgi:hypothetical protein
MKNGFIYLLRVRSYMHICYIWYFPKENKKGQPIHVIWNKYFTYTTSMFLQFYFSMNHEVIYQEITANQQSNVSEYYQFIVLWIVAASG